MSPQHSPRPAALRDFGRALLRASRLGASRLLLAGCGLLLALPALGQSRAWITNYMDGTLSEIDVATGTVVATVAVGGTPSGVAVSPAGDRVYISDATNNTVLVLDTATETVTGTVAVGVHPVTLALSPDGTRLYVANYTSSTVSVIDTVLMVVDATVGIARLPRGIDVTPDGQSVYVAGADSVTVIDTATLEVSEIPVGYTTDAVTSNPNGSRVYVGNSDGNPILFIDTDSKSIEASLFDGWAAHDMATSPDGARMYMPDFYAGAVIVFDTASENWLQSIEVGAYPEGIDFTPDGSQAYVVNGGSNTVSVIDTSTLAVINTIPVGSAPRALGHFIGPFAPRPAPPATGVDLSASPASPLVYAAEIVASEDSPVGLDNSAGAANLTTPLAYNFSPDEVRYARVECSGGMTFASDATVYVGGGALTTGAINGLNSSAIYFSLTATGTTGDGTWLTVTGTRRIAGTDPVDCTYGLYDFPSQAAAGGSPGRVTSVSGSYLDFAPSTTFRTTARTAVADVEAAPPFSGFVADGATTATTAALGALRMGLSAPAPLKPDGTPIALTDLHATGPDGTRVVVDGDFSAAANDDGSFDGAALNRVYLSANAGTCTFAGGIPASALDATEAEFAIGATATDRMLCLAPASGRPVPVADYAATLAAVAASEDYAPADVGPRDAGSIVHNGAQLQAQLVQVPAGWLSRLVLTNTGPLARPYTIAVTGEPGNAIDTGNLTGMVPAHGTAVIDLADVLTGFSGQPRATLNIDVTAPDTQIQGLYQTVNAATGAISNQTLVRPDTN